MSEVRTWQDVINHGESWSLNPSRSSVAWCNVYDLGAGTICAVIVSTVFAGHTMLFQSEHHIVLGVETSRCYVAIDKRRDWGGVRNGGHVEWFKRWRHRNTSIDPWEWDIPHARSALQEYATHHTLEIEDLCG